MSEEHNKAGKRNNPGSSDGTPLGSLLPVNQPSVTNKNYHPTPKDTPLDALTRIELDKRRTRYKRIW